MDIKWDLIEGGRVEVGAGVLEVTRTAVVSNIPARAQSDPFVLLRALERAMATAGQAAPGTGGRALLTGMVVSPARGTNDAKVSATFTAPSPDPGSGGAIRWVVEDSSTLASDHSELDVLGEPLHMLHGPAPGAGAPGGAFPGGVNMSLGPVPYPFGLNILRPRRVLSVNGYLIGKPDAVVLDALGCVNDRPWPTGSLFRNDPPKRMGAWLCSEVTSSVERPGLMPHVLSRQLYRVSARFMTKGRILNKAGRQVGDRDWSDWGVYKNILGRLAADMTEKKTVEAVKALMLAEYKVGQDHSIPGYTKVGNYGIYPMRDAFGF